MMSRRRFLVGAGVTMALPLLPSIARSDGDPPLRFVCFYTGNGIYRDHFMPTGTETDFTLQGTLAPLARHQSKLIVAHGASGLSGHYAGHTEALTGRATKDATFMPPGGPSLDQVLAADAKGKTPLPSLELGVDPWSSVDGVIAFSEAGLPIPPLADAGGAFDRVYGVASADPTVAARRRQQDLSVLDSVSADLKSLQGKLSASERRTLDQHLALFASQEDALRHPVATAQCDVGVRPSSGLDFPGTMTSHLSTIAAAFRCDVTRVATLVVKGAQDTTYYNWAGTVDDCHSIAHGAAFNSAGQFLSITTWHAEQLATLLDLLDAIPEGDGTVLDNTLVFWTNEIGLHDFSHSRDAMGVVLAGATKRFRSGRLVDLSGFLYQDLLLTILNGMGHPELTTFGLEGSQRIDALLA
jgi:hypothetical protein